MHRRAGPARRGIHSRTIGTDKHIEQPSWHLDRLHSARCIIATCSKNFSRDIARAHRQPPLNRKIASKKISHGADFFHRGWIFSRAKTRSRRLDGVFSTRCDARVEWEKHSCDSRNFSRDARRRTRLPDTTKEFLGRVSGPRRRDTPVDITRAHPAKVVVIADRRRTVARWRPMIAMHRTEERKQKRASAFLLRPSQSRARDRRFTAGTSIQDIHSCRSVRSARPDVGANPCRHALPNHACSSTSSGTGAGICAGCCSRSRGRGRAG